MAELHADRRRAESFGAASADYDRYRPRYPHALVAGLIPAPGAAVLDVGAGTGISSVQLAAAGAAVLAVEPDTRMAAVARAKGVSVENATFEEWNATGRLFDLVVFAQSFHSNHLGLSESDRGTLRQQLTARLGVSGVDAVNDAIAIICTPRI